MKNELRYNAAIGAPSAWRTLDDETRLRLVLASHAPPPKGHPKSSNLRVHSAMHVVVENHLALDEPAEARLTLARLQAEGLDRHEAIHAMGQVVAELTFAALQKAPNPANATERLVEGYRAMTAEKFRGALDEEG